MVRALRQDAGMSLRQLARKSNVDISSLSRLEKHIHHTLSPDNLARVAQALGVSVEELQRQVGQDGGPPPLRRWPTLEEWLARDPNLTERQRQAILAVYEAYVRR